MKKNLDHTALPTAEEIKLYQEGKLTPRRTHELELLAEENPLLGDALEGYAALPLFGAVPEVTAAVSKQAVSAVAGNPKGIHTAAKSGTAWWHLNGWIIGVGIGISAALITVAITRDDEKKTTAATPNHQASQPTQPVSGEEPSETTDYTVETTNTTKENSAAKDTKNHAEKTSSDMAASRNASSANSATPITSKAASLESSSVENKEQTAKLKLNNSSLLPVPVINLHHYRIADYSQLRKSDWKPLSIDEIGLPANYADYDNKKTDGQENIIISIPYLEYIDQCILAYDRKEYKTAIKGFAHILSQYNDDVNAQFYGAMSYYNHQQPVLALELLEKAEKNPINAFREETLFYKAKCLKMLNRTDEASELFRQIASSEGFYKAQAQKELND